MSLKDVFCQDRAIGLLQRSYSADRLAHALIFAGIEGVGKFKTASEWGKMLLCENPTGDKAGGIAFSDSCGKCKSCRVFEAGAHPDFNHIYKELREYTRDGKGKPPPADMPVDVIREFVIEKATTRPTLSQRKVFVIAEAEKLNANSQNCLLKILEEPPEFCCLILLCTRLDKLLATTRSRCQIVRFGLVDEERIVDRLLQSNMEQQKARYFARLSQGSIGLACLLASLETSGAELYEIKRNAVKAVSGLALADSLDIAESLVKSCKIISSKWSELEKTTSKTDINRRACAIVVSIVASVFHDVMKLAIRPDSLPINSDQIQCIRSLAQRLDGEQAASRIADCCQMLNWIESNVNEKLIFEQLLLNLACSDRMPA